MIEHIWTVVCGRSSTDRESNNMSLFDIIEQINVLGPLPDPATRSALPMQHEIVSVWSRANLAEAEESRARIRLVAPNGVQAFEQEFSIDLTVQPRMRTQLKSVGFPLLGTGQYRYTVEIRRTDETWQIVASIPVQLESMARPPVAEA
jgi:hypothetical protein